MSYSTAIICRIYHTYEEDMHRSHISSAILWLLRGVAEGYVTTVAEDIRGPYPPSKSGMDLLL